MLQTIFQHLSAKNFDRDFESYRRTGAALEYCIDSNELDGWKPPGENGQVGRLESELTGPLSIHGPVYGFDPASRDDRIAGLAWQRCMTVFEIAAKLDPEVIVFHSSYNPYTYGGGEERWKDRTVRFWERAVEQLPTDRVRVVVENIHDVTPGPLAAVVQAIVHPRFGFCLDVGHFNVYVHNHTIDEYLLPFQGRLMHVHLHDNDGEKDQHLPPGEGAIAYSSIVAGLRKVDGPWTLTVECRNPWANANAAAWAENHLRQRRPTEPAPTGPLRSSVAEPGSVR